MKDRIKVLVIDDSSYMRYLVSNVLASDPAMELAGTAGDGLEALDRIRQSRPDVVVLDLEMPKLDGIGFLERLSEERLFLPVVVFSRLAEEGAEKTIRALELGALDFITKPKGSDALTLKHMKKDLLAKIRGAAGVSPDRLAALRTRRTPAKKAVRVERSTLPLKRVIVVASSTGGPPALEELVSGLPGDLPACLLIIQHMPRGFTRSLAERLNDCAALQVKEAAERDAVKPAIAYLAPGDFHMRVDPRGALRLSQDAPVNSVRPAADVTMASVAEVYGERSMAVVLTGMGFDGTRGGHLIRKAGGCAIAEDTATCVVDGMPSSLIKSGNADRVLPLRKIAGEIVALVRSQA